MEIEPKLLKEIRARFELAEEYHRHLREEFKVQGVKKMARETKEARLARELKEREEVRREQADAVRATWHRRIALLLLALRNESEVSVIFDDEGWLKVKDNRDVGVRFWTEPSFPLDLDGMNDNVVIDYERSLEHAEALPEDLNRERREAERKAQLRRDALEKLNAEEREVLGL